MLERIRLQNFKTHRDTEIKLGRLTVLVGPNGSGKSSVLQAIELFPRLLAPRANTATILGPLKMRPSIDETVGDCRLTIGGTIGSINARTPWQCRASIEAGLQYSNTTDVALRALTRPLLLSLSPSRLSEPVPVSQVNPVLEADGFGLAELVATMRVSDDESFERMNASLCAVVPQLERVAVRRTEVPYKVPVATNDPDGPDVTYENRIRLGHELVFDMKSGRKKIPAKMMSGGTLISVAILALLYSQARPRILLIDDIDHALHPRAQWDLLKQLRGLLERFPELQIVATSHSPDLVDELAPEEVVVTALREDGTSAARPLTECPRSDLLGVLKAGQLWSAVGEDWVKDAAEPGQ